MITSSSLEPVFFLILAILPCLEGSHIPSAAPSQPSLLYILWVLVFWHLGVLFFSVSNPTFSYPFYIYLFSFFEQGLMNTSILLCSCGWPSIFLSPSPKFWDYRHLPPHSVPVSLNTTHIFTDISPSVLLPALFNICTWRDTSNFTGLKKRNMIFLPLSLPLAWSSRKWSHHSQATQGKGLMSPGFFPVAF